MWLGLLFQAGGWESGAFPAPSCHIPAALSPQGSHPAPTGSTGAPGTPQKEGTELVTAAGGCVQSINGILGVSAAPMEQSQHQPRALRSGKTCLGTAAKAELCFPTCKGRPRAFAKPSVGFGVCSGSAVSLLCESSLILNQQPLTRWWSLCPGFGMPPRPLAFPFPFPTFLQVFFPPYRP